MNTLNRTIFLIVILLLNACSTHEKESVNWKKKGVTIEQLNSDQIFCNKFTETYLSDKKSKGRRVQMGAHFSAHLERYPSSKNKKIVKGYCMNQKGYFDKQS